MLNIFYESVVSGVSAEDQLIYGKHGSGDIFKLF